MDLFQANMTYRVGLSYSFNIGQLSSLLDGCWVLFAISHFTVIRWLKFGTGTKYAPCYIALHCFACVLTLDRRLRYGDQRRVGCTERTVLEYLPIMWGASVVSGQ